MCAFLVEIDLHRTTVARQLAGSRATLTDADLSRNDVRRVLDIQVLGQADSRPQSYAARVIRVHSRARSLGFRGAARSARRSP